MYITFTHVYIYIHTYLRYVKSKTIGFDQRMKERQPCIRCSFHLQPWSLALYWRKREPIFDWVLTGIINQTSSRSMVILRDFPFNIMTPVFSDLTEHLGSRLGPQIWVESISVLLFPLIHEFYIF